jgi:hypothetical protein
MSGSTPSPRRLLLLAAVAVALLPDAAAAQDSVELKMRSAVGERRLVVIESSVDATITATDLEEKATPRSILTQRKERFVEETVEVDEAKAPLQARLNCLASTVEERAAGETTGGVRKTPVQGRIVTVKREGAGWTALPLGAEPLAADQLAPLGRWNDLRLLLKGGPVKVGESWTPAADRLGSLVLGKDAGAPEVRCTLNRIVPGSPARAEVGLTLRFDKGKEGDDDRIQGQLAGLLVFDLAAGKPLSFSLAGGFQAVQNARDASGTSVGKIDVQARKVELKIAFEPVQQP